MTNQVLNFPRWAGQLTRPLPSRPAPAPTAPAVLTLGRVLVTSGAFALLDHAGVAKLLRRHLLGDWGDLDLEDAEQNERALVNGDRVFSSYDQGDHRFYVITEADRSCTTVLLAEEY